MDKLHIRNEMAQFDRKNRDFYDELTDEERKKFSNYLMIRWGSAVRGDQEIQEYYLRSTNHYLNRHFFDINRHPKLQWLCATAVSPGLGDQSHIWIKPKKKDRESTAGATKKAVMAMFPNAKESDIEVIMSINTADEIRDYQRRSGQQD